MKVPIDPQVVFASARQTGKVMPKPCRDCGSERVQGHHPDYSKPLEVVWLCGPCHKKEHAKLRRENWRNNMPEGIFKLRFPPDEYKAIKRAAEKDRRSIQNFVQYATVEMLKSRGEIR